MPRGAGARREGNDRASKTRRRLRGDHRILEHDTGDRAGERGLKHVARSRAQLPLTRLREVRRPLCFDVIGREPSLQKEHSYASQSRGRSCRSAKHKARCCRDVPRAVQSLGRPSASKKILLSPRPWSVALRNNATEHWTDAVRQLHLGERIYTFWKYFRNAFPRRLTPHRSSSAQSAAGGAPYFCQRGPRRARPRARERSCAGVDRVCRGTAPAGNSRGRRPVSSQRARARTT